MKINNLSPVLASSHESARVTRRVRSENSQFQSVAAAAAANTSSPAVQKTASAPATPATAALSPTSTTNVFALVTPAASTAAPASSQSQPAAADSHPTAESVFGANPWMSSPGGYSALGGAYNYNPMYFATRETADKVAQLLGGTVVAANWMTGAAGSPFIQNQPNYMVQLPNGHLVNAGLTATYYTHGWSQSFIDHMLDLDRNA
jgi:hypothetical protein